MTDTAEAPPPPVPARTPFDQIGGREVVEAIAHRFYDLIEGDPAYAAVKATHGGDFGRIRDALAGFLTAWLGGPRDYFEKGGPCMVSLHKRIDISGEAGRQWADAMRRVIADQPGMAPRLGSAMADALADMARGLVNRA